MRKGGGSIGGREGGTVGMGKAGEEKPGGFRKADKPRTPCGLV